MAGFGARAKAGPRRPVAVQRISLGLRDRDIEYLRDPDSFRQSSFDAVRSYYRERMRLGETPTQIASSHMRGASLPVRLDIEASGKVHLNEGRHRLSVAREMAAKAIRARVVQYGPRGGIKWERDMVVPLR